MSPKRYIKRYKQQNELWETVRLTSCQKPTITIHCNLLHVYPSVPSFVFTVLLIPSFNVLSSYFYGSLNLLAVSCCSKFNEIRGHGTGPLMP